MAKVPLENEDMAVEFGSEKDKDVDNKSVLEKSKNKDKWCFRCCSKGITRKTIRLICFVLSVRAMNMWHQTVPQRKSNSPWHMLSATSLMNWVFTIYLMDKFILRRKMASQL